jgi:predicted DNA-binding transcriptional regulator YafY
MRRADRLFQIVQLLRGRRVVTAAQLAAKLGISQRTLYRDIQDLSLSGVPILGEAGVGYRMGSGFEMPPIMFTFDEVEALVAGIRVMESWGGPELGASARSALEKIAHALPENRRKEIESAPIYAPGFHVPPEAFAHLDEVRKAIVKSHKVEICYRDGKGASSARVVHPLGLYFWGTQWTLVAWCEVRVAFRTFRLDRITSLKPTGECFPAEPDKSLPEFLRLMRALHKQGLKETASGSVDSASN